MGREIRRVPENWEHPKKEDGKFQPMNECNFEEAFQEWLEAFDRVRDGDLTDDERKWYPKGFVEWLQEQTPPDPKYYAPYTVDQCSWYQLYENVSEGTPLTPAFASKEEIVNYLCNHGDFWDKSPWDKAAAEKMVESEYAPSFWISNGVMHDARNPN